MRTKFTSRDVNRVCWNHFCKFLISTGSVGEDNVPLFSCYIENYIKLPSPLNKGCYYKRTSNASFRKLLTKFRRIENDK